MTFHLPPVIGVYAPAPESGKSTLAQYLIKHHGYVLLPYAKPLKELAVAFLLKFGISLEAAEDYVYFNKSHVIPEVGVNARHILRTLGTEWGRTCIHPDTWVRIFNHNITQLPPGSRVIVDDVRRFNEAKNLLQLHDAQLIHLTRPSGSTDTDHASEGELDLYEEFFDYFLVNDGTIADLHVKVETLLAPEGA